MRFFEGLLFYKIVNNIINIFCKKPHHIFGSALNTLSVLKKFTIFTGKHQCWRLQYFNFSTRRLEKETSTQAFSFEYCEIFKNTYFEEHRRTATSASTTLHSQCCQKYNSLYLNIFRILFE